MNPEAGRRLIDETVGPRREAQLSVIADSDPDPLPVAKADLLYLWDEYGVEYLDFAALMHPFGHRFQPIYDMFSQHLRYYGWTGSPTQHMQRWPVMLAEKLSASFSSPDEEPWQVLFCEGQRDALDQALTLVGADRGGEPLAYPQGSPEHADWSQVSALLVASVAADYSPIPSVREWMLAAREAGVPVIFDETLTGFGRTGTMWGQEQVGLVADATVLGGPVGGGLPLGAVVAPPRIALTDPDPSPHAGHPWACAGGFVVMDTINPAMFTHADDCGREIAEVLAELCQQFPNRLAGHHGVGLLRGLRFHNSDDAAALPTAARAQGLHLAPAVGNTVLIAPVLVSGPNEMRRGLDIIASTVLSWEDTVGPGQQDEEG